MAGSHSDNLTGNATRPTALPASHATSSESGRKKKWYLNEWFERLRDNRLTAPGSDRQSSMTTLSQMFITCVGCDWQSYAKTENATQLGDHLLKCPQIPRDVKMRLLQERSLLKRDRKRFSGHSELFGVQGTPSKKKRSRYSSEEAHRRSMVSRTPSARGLSLERESPTLSMRLEERIESEDSFRKRTRLNELVTPFVINTMLPFSILSRTPGSDFLFQIAKILNPELCEQLPTPYKMSERNLNAYYDSMLKSVKSSITSTLVNCYGTLVFDGWTDVSKESVVNVLLSVTGVERVRKTFFLRSIYSGSQSCDAEYYANVLEEVMLSFGGMNRVCSIVSDNASCCVKAKEMMIEKHNHLLSSQDQRHVANLLMQDLGRISWIDSILTKISYIVSELRRHPKLYHRFKELKDHHNIQLLSDTLPLAATRDAVDHYGRPALPRTAVLPCKMSNTRFACSEYMLRSVLRSLKVFARLIDCPDFVTNLFGTRGARARERRVEFERLLRDQALFRDALDAYHILRLVLQYLRLFDDETSLVSEVVPATMELRHRLTMLPLTVSFTAERRNEVIAVFDERLNGTSRRIPLLTTLHRVAFYFDIRSTYQNMAADREHLSIMMRNFVRSNMYPASETSPDRGGEDRAVKLLLQELSLLRLSWPSSGMDTTKRDLLWSYSDIPVVYWIDFQDKKSLLREFALRILDTSPSSSMVERSFSHQGRIRTAVRNRLNHEKVRKMVFCSFNDVLSSKRSLRIDQLCKRSYQDIRFGGWNRSMNSTTISISGSHAEGHLFGDFYAYEGDSDAVVEENDVVEIDNLDIEDVNLASTSEALDLFE